MLRLVGCLGDLLGLEVEFPWFVGHRGSRILDLRRRCHESSDLHATPEFKDEAVRQVVERGYTVKEVAERLGISEASLYTWRKAVVPSKDDERAEELLETKRENLTLRSELRRTQEERDILKKAAVYFAREFG